MAAWLRSSVGVSAVWSAAAAASVATADTHITAPHVRNMCMKGPSRPRAMTAPFRGSGAIGPSVSPAGRLAKTFRRIARYFTLLSPLGGVGPRPVHDHRFAMMRARCARELQRPRFRAAALESSGAVGSPRPPVRWRSRTSGTALYAAWIKSPRSTTLVGGLRPPRPCSQPVRVGPWRMERRGRASAGGYRSTSPGARGTAATRVARASRRLRRACSTAARPRHQPDASQHGHGQQRRQHFGRSEARLTAIQEDIGDASPILSRDMQAMSGEIRALQPSIVPPAVDTARPITDDRRTGAVLERRRA